MTFVGDDDGLMPYALRELARLVDRFDRPDAVHWSPGYYYWPDIAARGAANYMILPLTRSIKEHSGRSQLGRLARREIVWSDLPTLYHSVVNRRVIDKHLEIVGRMFVTSCPDVYSAYAFAYLCKSYVSGTVPMHLNGASGSSNGVASAIQLDQSQAGTVHSLQISREFKLMNEEAGYLWHPTVPACGSIQTYYDNSFQYARDLLFPSDDDLAIDRREMVRSYLDGVLSTDPVIIERVISAIRESLADRPDLLPWFEEEAAKDRAAVANVNPIHKPERLGFDGRYLLLDTEPFGISDIAGAVTLASNILQVGKKTIRYDLEAVGDVAIRTERLEYDLGDRTKQLEEALELLEQRTREAERDLADRAGQLEEVLALLGQRTQQAQELSELLVERAQQAQELSELLVERTERLEDLTRQTSAQPAKAEVHDVEMASRTP